MEVDRERERETLKSRSIEIPNFFVQGRGREKCHASRLREMKATTIFTTSEFCRRRRVARDFWSDAWRWCGKQVGWLFASEKQRVGGKCDRLRRLIL